MKRKALEAHLREISQRLRDVLHQQLDELLTSTTFEAGEHVPVLASMTKRAMLGFAFTVRIDTVSPGDVEEGKAPEAPTAEPLHKEPN